MKVAIAQINTTAGDVNGNLKKAMHAYLHASNLNADLVIFPELTLPGYPCEDLLFRKDFLIALHEALDEFAAYTTDCTAIIGTAFYPDARALNSEVKLKPFNTAAVCRDGKIQGTYFKRHLPNYGVFDEKRYFALGGPLLGDDLFTIAGKKVGISICEDAWVQDSPLLSQSLVADILVNLSASPFQSGRILDRQSILSDRARMCHTPLVYVNLVGGQDELVFDGGSLAFDGEGELIARSYQFEEDVAFVDIDLDSDRQAVHEGTIVSPLGREHEIYCALVTGTQDYIRKSGFHRALIGLSGGIDSALVAAIAAEALGPDNVIGILMPSRYSSKGSITDAVALAKGLGIATQDIPIIGPHMALETSLQPAYNKLFPLSPEGIAEENLQARIRGTIMMALSNKSGAMVLTTGNKSELAVGYATLYGDMAGGFAVLKDVPKTLVYALCESLNSWGAEVIPKTIINKAPSAELRPEQRDTDSLPDYEILDRIIAGYVERDHSAEEIVDRNHDLDPDLVRNVCRMIDRNEYKRRQSAPGIRISPKAFGKDRRLPIVNGWY